MAIRLAAKKTSQPTPTVEEKTAVNNLNMIHSLMGPEKPTQYLQGAFPVVAPQSFTYYKLCTIIRSEGTTE